MINNSNSRIVHVYPNISTRIQYADSISAEDKLKVSSLPRPIRAKLSTTKKEVVHDRKDVRNINAFRRIKIAMPYENGSLILMGNFEISYSRDYPVGANFYCHNIAIGEATLDSMSAGVDVNISFTNSLSNPTSPELMTEIFKELNEDDNFVVNINQFDDFMRVFSYYKELSAELNNNVNYEIIHKSEPYYFLSVDYSQEISRGREIYDDQGVLKGYRISEDVYNYLSDDTASKVRYVINFTIRGGNEELRKIRRIGSENIYVSNFNKINNNNSKELKQVNLINVQTDKDRIILTGELKSNNDYDESYGYLNLYDMGQKIKIESIELSLKLIKQGSTGSALELLEYLIGDKDMPNHGTHRATKAMEPYLQGLNDSQKRAFIMAVDGSPVSLIKGPPGTGKTHVINAITRYITKELGQKVIVSSQTHVAIDNVLDQLMKNYDIVIPKRITNRRNKYSSDELDATLYRTWGRSFFEFNSQRVKNTKLAKAMEQSMSHFDGDKRFSYTEKVEDQEYSVTGATTTTTAIAGRKGKEVFDGYDWLIIDEVSKCPITEVLRYLPYVNHIIMVGDDYQLSPLLEIGEDEAKELSCYDPQKYDELKSVYEDSVFAKVMDKAIKSHRMVLLNENYRSVRSILDIYNVFYNGELKGLREEVDPRVVRFNDSDFDNHDVFFIEALYGQEKKEGTSRLNVKEAEITARYLEKILETVNNPQNVTVSAIFPYAAQINYFEKHNRDLINRAKKTFKSFDIDTVDAFQGKESDIILADTVVTDSSSKNFLQDFRRINVSMSRARDKLFIFGNSRTLSKIDMRTNDNNSRKYFGDIINYIKSECPRGLYIEHKDKKEVTNNED